MTGPREFEVTLRGCREQLRSFLAAARPSGLLPGHDPRPHLDLLRATFREWTGKVSTILPEPYLDWVTEVWGISALVLSQVSTHLLEAALQHIRSETYQWINPTHPNRDHVLHHMADGATAFWLCKEWRYGRGLCQSGAERRLLESNWGRYSGGCGPACQSLDWDRIWKLAYTLTGLLHDIGYHTYVLSQILDDTPFDGWEFRPRLDWAVAALRDSLLADVLAEQYEYDLVQALRQGNLTKMDIMWAAAHFRQLELRLRGEFGREMAADLFAAMELATTFTFFHDLGWEKEDEKTKPKVPDRKLADQVLGKGKKPGPARFEKVPACALFMLTDMLQIGARPFLVGVPQGDRELGVMRFHISEGVRVLLPDPDGHKIEVLVKNAKAHPPGSGDVFWEKTKAELREAAERFNEREGTRVEVVVA